MRNSARVATPGFPVVSEELRDNEVLRAAAQIFLERGFRATRLQDIADAAGVSYAEVADRYGNRETIFRLIVDAEVSAMRMPFVEAIPTFETTLDAARFAAERQHLLMTRTILPRLAHLVMAETEQVPEIADTLLTNDGREMSQAVGEASMQALIMRGLIREDTNVPFAVRQFYGMLNQAFNHEHIITGKPIPDLHEYMEDCVQWFVSRYGV
ncbi:MAG: helix-turn-helix domain-containing protein [Pseudomonadota bacterium]